MKLRQAALLGAASVVFAAVAFAQPAREHLVCYAAKPSKKACAVGQTNAGALCEDDTGCTPGGEGTCAAVTKFPKGVVARLNDVNDPNELGEDKTFNVKKPTRLCIPGDKNNEGIDDPQVSYLTYPVKQAGTVCVGGTNADLPCKEPADCPSGTCQEIAGFDGDEAKNQNHLLDDQYTNIRLNAAKVDFMMVPASRCDGNDNATCVPTAAPVGEESYKCYKAKATKTVCSASSSNAFNTCDDDVNCPGGTCADLAKFAKGQDAYFSGDFITGERTFGIGKLSHFCTAVETTVPAGGTPTGPVNPKARLLCYKSKATKGACDASSPTNRFGACKDEEDCGSDQPEMTTYCDAQLKFNKEDANVLGLYENDAFDLSGDPNDYHRTNLSKEDMVCMPACEGNDLSYTSHVLRATSLQIPATGDPGDGQDVDSNMSTCQPSGNCSGGIDNVFGNISGFIPDLNTALQGAVDDGSINILLNLNTFANGAQQVSGFTADLDTPPGCVDNDPNTPPNEVNDPNQVCNYIINNAALDPASCNASSDIRFDVAVSGLPGSPAQVAGGGEGSNLGFSLPFGDIPIAITARNVKVGADVTHSGGVVQSATGALGGALVQRELRDALDALPDGICAGGPNDGDACTMANQATTCPMSTCDTNYLGGFSPNDLGGFIEVLLTRDIDTDGQKTCEGSDGGMPPVWNNGQPCVLDSDCPQNPVQSNGGAPCDQYDAHSLGIAFTAINAAITEIERPCDKATCSLY